MDSMGHFLFCSYPLASYSKFNPHRHSFSGSLVSLNLGQFLSGGLVGQTAALCCNSPKVITEICLLPPPHIRYPHPPWPQFFRSSSWRMCWLADSESGMVAVLGYFLLKLGMGVPSNAIRGSIKCPLGLLFGQGRLSREGSSSELLANITKARE